MAESKYGGRYKALWNDLVSDVMSKKLYSTTGKVDYDWDENAIKFQSGVDITNKADRVQCNYQWGHGLLYGDSDLSQFRFHLHLEQTSDSDVFTFTLKYRKQNNLAEKTTAWTTITASTPDDLVDSDFSGYTTKNNMLIFPAIDCSDLALSSTIQIMLARTDTTTGDVYVTFMDAHVPFADFGSRGEYTL